MEEHMNPNSADRPETSWYNPLAMIKALIADRGGPRCPIREPWAFGKKSRGRIQRLQNRKRFQTRS